MVKLKGKVTVIEKDGEKAISTEQKENVITYDGFEKVARYMNGESLDDVEYMAIGEDSTTELESDSQLGAQTAIRGPVPHSYVAMDYAVEFDYTYSAGAGGTQVTEMGMYDGASGTSVDGLFNRVTFSAKNNDDYELDISYMVEVVGGSTHLE